MFRIMNMNTCTLFLMSINMAMGFAPQSSIQQRQHVATHTETMTMPNAMKQSSPTTVMGMTNTENDQTQTKLTTAEINDLITVPTSLNEMIDQVSATIKQSQEEGGLTKQIIRILLPRDSKSGQLGQYYETNVLEDITDLEAIALVPPDETWQGGIMQLYRAISIPTKLILRNLGGTVGGVPPTIIEDRSVDTSEVDGVGIYQSQVPNNPSKDICCFVQPLQETIDAIESISQQAGDERLVLLLNPQWRNIDDALDTASKQTGFLGNLASFLGGKGNSLKMLDQLGFESTYMIEGYVCMGGNVILMKRFDSDWVVFAENDSETDYIRVGTKSDGRPTYQDVEQMLIEKGVSLKYARDIGLAPKLE
jgi:hypothetical protein